MRGLCGSPCNAARASLFRFGVGPTKTLAKVANRRAKRDPASDGVFAMLDESDTDAELASLDLTQLWGVGHRLAARLRDMGIMTPFDLKRANPRFIRERFSVVLERTVLELRGIPCLALEEAMPDRKSVTVSRSFGRAVETLHELHEAVATFTARAAEKMRRQGLVTARLTVFAHTSRFCAEDEQFYAAQSVTLPVATADSGKLIAAAGRALAALFRPGYRYAKAGVLFLDFVRQGAAQGSLFDLMDDAPAMALMRTVDGLNRRYGRDTVTYAAAGTHRTWGVRSAFLSQRYTTCWDELLTVTDIVDYTKVTADHTGANP